MQATRPLRVAATRALREGNELLLAKASPGMVKTWKSYSYTRNLRVQQLSPFEVDVLGPLFRNVAGKIKHKIEDNATDVLPAFVFFVSLVSFVKWKRQDILLHHRD